MPTPVMDALVEIGGAIMGVNCWEHGRNLKKMGLEDLTLEQVIETLKFGKRP